jgi:hypothetical protein
VALASRLGDGEAPGLEPGRAGPPDDSCAGAGADPLVASYGPAPGDRTRGWWAPTTPAPLAPAGLALAVAFVHVGLSDARGPVVCGRVPDNTRNPLHARYL